jgi:hypothetical protein
LVNQFLGLTTVLPLASQAPHQPKELLAIIWFLKEESRDKSVIAGLQGIT